jgi:hypothetical protein
MEHVLAVLRGHPAGVAAKLEAFAMLNGITAAFALQEQADPELQQRNAAYLVHAITSGEHPRLAELLSREPQQPAPDEQVTDRYPDIMARILTALLGELLSELRADAEEADRAIRLELFQGRQRRGLKLRLEVCFKLCPERLLLFAAQ